MMDGLWTIEFGSGDMFGAGVAVFFQGRILGGDAAHFYDGSYDCKQGSFTATIQVNPFIDGVQTVFRTMGKNLTLKISGTRRDEENAIAQGELSGDPNLKIGIKLTKRRAI